MRITSVTPMKNEAPFLLEWVAYHRLIGVNDMIVFTNDCTDGTDRMLERLDELGELRHFTNPSFLIEGAKHHLTAIRYFNKLMRPSRSDWVVSFDADEFMCVNVGEGRLTDLFAAKPDANVWSLSQLNFGHGGVTEYTDDLVTDQFRYCWRDGAPYHADANRRGAKTLTHKSSEPVEWHNHSPVFDEDKLRLARVHNGSGERLRHLDLRKDVKHLDYPYYGYGMVQLNHYALRSIDSYMLKVSRGNANHAQANYGLPYWRRYDRNDQYDDKILRWTDRIAEKRDEYLKDPELRDLHQAAVANAQDQIAAAKQTPEGQALMKRLTRYVTNHPGVMLDDGDDLRITG